MIYFDNAATTKYKPESVYDAANYYFREIGVSPGRGSYQLGIQASRMLYQSRVAVGRYFGLSEPDRVIFTKNSTEAINLCLNGILNPGDHVLTTCYEHNAVLRPLETLKRKGIIEYSIISREDLDLTPAQIFQKYARPSTRMIVMTLASNLTGRIVFNEEVFKYFKSKGILTFLDSSQGGGKSRPQMNSQCIDFLAFTGHKDLLAIPGVGGLCCETNEHIRPLLQGGTGIHGEDYVDPDIFPEGYEAGTLNMPAIWSLHASIEYLEKEQKRINEVEGELISYLTQKLQTVKNLVLYDPSSRRVSTCCFNLEGIPSDQVVYTLDKHGICVRGGIHCAILAHEALGTMKQGAVRVSLSFKNTKDEIDQLIDVLNGEES